MRQTPGPLPRIVDRRQGHRQHLAWRLVVADAQGHGRPQRGIRQRAVQYIARFKGAGGGVSRVRKQAQGRRDRLRFAAIACRQRLAADAGRSVSGSCTRASRCPARARRITTCRR